MFFHKWPSLWTTSLIKGISQPGYIYHFSPENNKSVVVDYLNGTEVLIRGLSFVAGVKDSFTLDDHHASMSGFRRLLRA